MALGSPVLWIVGGIVTTVVVAAAIVIVTVIFARKKQQNPTLTSFQGDNTLEYVPSYYNTLNIIPHFWNNGLKGQGIKVLVIDTGVETSHPDLQDVIATNTNNEEDNHGTHVAGIIGADINDKGIVGVAPDCEIHIWDMQRGYDDQIIGAFDYAIANDIDVINMSWGGTWDDPRFHQKIKNCHNAGIFLVGAAGNESSDRLVYPAAYDEVISVVSLDSQGDMSWFTNFDPVTADVAAYGEDILSANADFQESGNLTLELSGTSMATPFVVGLCALILQREKEAGRPRPTQAQMIELLKAYLPPLKSKS